MRGTHIVSFDMKRLGVRRTAQIFATRQARSKWFMMESYLIIVLLTFVLSTTDVVKASLKSKSDGSFNSKNMKNLCTSCRVTRKLSNQTVEHGDRLTLRCAFRGIQPRNITWFRNGKRVKKNKNVLISEWSTHSGSRLRIKNFTSREAGWYSCVGRNSRDQYIFTNGYMKIKRADRGKVNFYKQPTTHIPVKQRREGKCEMYKGTICSPYIQDNVLIFVEKDPKKSQEFIEKKLSYGYKAMSKNLTNSCRSLTLPFWCHYHFPTCSVANAQPKSICKSECNLVRSKHCKKEYEWTRKTSSQSSEDDLFPDCKNLPNEDPVQRNCVSISRHVSSLRTELPAGKTASGQCKIYSGGVCTKKAGKKVFVEDGVEISDLEKVIKEELKRRGHLSKQCQDYFEPLLCQLRLPDCDASSGKPKGMPICQDECLVLKNKFCRKEYSPSSVFFDCSSVAPFTRASGKCSAIGVPQKYLQESRDKKIPVPSKKPMIGRCQPYKGSVCKKYLDKKNIFVEVDNRDSNIERKLTIARDNIRTFTISAKCEPFVLPLMCHHLFPYCETTNSQPKPSYICRNDCLRIQHDFCPREYLIAEEEALTGHILFPRCHDLSQSNEHCTSLRRLFITNQTESIPGDCYHGKGREYRGLTNTTESGTPCQPWDARPGSPHPELNVGHNYCRNPGGNRKKPWCFTLDQDGAQLCNIPKCDSYDAPLNGSGENYLGTLNRTQSDKFCESWIKHEPKHKWAHNYCRNPKGSKRQPWCYVGEKQWEYCNVRKVAARIFPESGGHLSNLLYTVIPCVVFGLIVAVVIIAVCWKRHKQGPDAIKKNTRVTVTVLLPELRTIPGENILLPKFLGNGKFGSMYTGDIYTEDGSRVSRLVKVALKECREEFINQARRWSQFHHPNLLTIEAITSGSEPVTLVYEPAGHGNLYQYLIYHSPNNPNFTRDHALLDQGNLLDISRQIAAGMAYLSSHDYVHGELMTRNCQVAHSTVIKITDFTIHRDVCYFRRPNKGPLALGWMAPETLQTEIYTVNSDVWAFGVLLWEIFTYGFQPYFGFTFPEVQEKILNMVLLEQPRNCIPAIYELMKTCWKKNPTHRAHFVDLHEELNALCEQFFDEQESDDCYVTTTLNV